MLPSVIARGGILLGNAVVLTAIGAAQPACAQDVIPPKVYSTTPGGVNVADGSFVYSVTDGTLNEVTTG